MQTLIPVRWQRLWLTASLAAIFFIWGMPAPARAVNNTSWERAISLRQPLAGRVLYGALGREGSSAWYRFSVSRSAPIRIHLGVPTWADSRFKPQLVLYRPDSMTIGPVLPMDQPPRTLALIYPSADWAVALDPATLIDYRVFQATTLDAPRSTGWYYLAVYNAGSAGGRWRLEFNGRPQFNEILRWPGQWWGDNAWAGWTLRTAFVPLWLALMIAAAAWLANRKKKHQSRKRKKTV